MDAENRASKRKVEVESREEREGSDEVAEPESFSQSNSDYDGPQDRDGDGEGEDGWDNDSLQGKRSIGRSPSSKAALDAARKKARGNYRCSKCGQPKKGHVCPYQPRYKRRDSEQATECVDAEVQVEMDPDMTVRQLPLNRQGYPESYAIKQDQADPQAVANAHLLSNMLHGNAQAGLLASVAGGYGMNFGFTGVPGAESFPNTLLPQLQNMAAARQASGADVQNRQIAEQSASASSTG